MMMVSRGMLDGVHEVARFGYSSMVGSPKVSIVVVPRERFNLTELSLESIYAHTAGSFELIYVDGRSPGRVRRYLENAARRHDFRLIRSASYLTPNRARNLGLKEASGEYVVFLDNDVLVGPGWLEALVARAEKSEGWAVGPLYLEGDPDKRIVHMAGGAYSMSGEPPHRRFETEHLHQGHRLDELREPLAPGLCDFVEFHCMLVRADVLRRLGPLDEELMSTREHLDLCLSIRAAGGTVWFEPGAVVSYLTPPPLALSDIPFYLLRWSDDWTRKSLERFTDKHGIDTSYRERARIAAARRSIVFPSARRLAERMLGSGARRTARRMLAALERATSRWTAASGR
jgi:GT2 family glycosyltransferase